MRKLIFLLLFPWLISCSNLSTIPTAKDSTIDKAFESSEQYNVDMQELPSAVTDALIPDFDTSLLDEHSDNVAQFNLSLHDVNARDFFLGLVAGTNENMLVHPDVSGTISLSLKKGQTTVIVGPSGTGKSVTLRHMVGLLRPDAGEILFEGENILGLSGKKLRDMRSKFGMLFQSNVRGITFKS